jgi:hypothetical protein
VIFDIRRTVFVILSFEGPDVYSQAGGLGVRVKGLSRALAQLGYQTYLYFCGDPDLPGEEDQEAGRLHYRRWCQWISATHRGGVYDGEEGKIRDWNSSLPASVIDNVIAPAVAVGSNVVVMGEEWHTSWSMQLISDLLYYRGLRDKVVMLWNANNTYGNRRGGPRTDISAESSIRGRPLLVQDRPLRPGQALAHGRRRGRVCEAARSARAACHTWRS